MSDYNEHLISMAGGDGDHLEAIEARVNSDEESFADRDALLAMVREQRAAIERVREWVDKFEANRPSVYTIRDDNQFDKGYSSGRRSAGAIIRAALITPDAS
jgi:hypothetical protein